MVQQFNRAANSCDRLNIFGGMRSTVAQQKLEIIR
jgi:hypothetical protein